MIGYNSNQIGHNPTQMDSYNKMAQQGQGTFFINQGTLMANWFEERVHR
jgi:hypothetical protein